MPNIRIEMLHGRTQEVKNALVKDVTEAVARNTGAQANHIQVVIVEHEAQNWSLAGVMLSDQAING